MIVDITSMNQTIAEKIIRFSSEVREMFSQLRQLIYSVEPTVEEKLWAGLPSYYVGKEFVRLIPFKDHINIEVSIDTNCREQLSQYKFSPKGMLQIYIGQEIPSEVLLKIFDRIFHNI